MNSLNRISTEEAATILQRRYRHHRYMQKNRGLGEAYTKPLFVKQLTNQEFPMVVKVIQDWRSGLIDHNLRQIYDGLSIDLKKNDPKRPVQSVAAFDSQRKLQGIATFRVIPHMGDLIWICNIAVSPSNHSGKTFKGVGTSIIEKIIHIATKLDPIGKEDCFLGLAATESAADFYISRHFKIDDTAVALFSKSNRSQFMNQFSGRALPLN